LRGNFPAGEGYEDDPEVLKYRPYGRRQGGDRQRELHHRDKGSQHKEIKIDDLEEQGYGRRANCRRCEEKIPRSIDLAFGNWGDIGPDAGKATFVEVCSESGHNCSTTL
jgi:hypothetical protein